MSEQKEAQVAGSRSFLSQHKKPVVAIAIIIIGVLGYCIYRLNHKPVSTYVAVQATNTCTTGTGLQLLRQAVPLSTQPKYLQLKKVVDKIQKLPDYQRDPNCLYMVITYEVNAADAGSASDNFNKLVKVYNPNVGFTPYLGRGASLQALQTSINTLKQVLEQSKTNSHTFGNP